jgi:uncharacterized protein (DUF58 family)
MTEDYRNYLDPRVLNKIHRLDLKARLIVEGFVSGMHRSPFHGFSVEFASHRQYVPGDDTRHIDWKVYSKTDRFFLKQYEEETNLTGYVLLDVSESMRYRGAKAAMSKYDYAASVAAALGFLMVQQQDAFGVAMFDNELRELIPARANQQQLLMALHRFEQTKPERKTNVTGILNTLAEKFQRRGLVILISDLFVNLDDLFRGLEHFRHRRHEVMVLHVMDEDELTFPFEGNTLFRGYEQLGELMVEPRSLRKDYLAALNEFLTQVKRRCAAKRIDYRLINTNEHLDAALAAFLAARDVTAKVIGARR